MLLLQNSGQEKENIWEGLVNEWKAAKWWLQQLCPFTFIWALPHSCSWGHPSQYLCPPANSQLVGVLSNASPFVSGKRERLKTERVQAENAAYWASPLTDTSIAKEPDEAEGEYWPISAQMLSNWDKAECQYLTQCSNRLTKNTPFSKHLRHGSSESGSWQHNKAQLTPGLLIQTSKSYCFQNPPETFPSLISYWAILYFAFPETGYESQSWNKIHLISQGRYAPQTMPFFTRRRVKKQGRRELEKFFK